MLRFEGPVCSFDYPGNRHLQTQAMALPTSKRFALHAKAAPCLPCPIKHQEAAKSRSML
jgi:hypothetical protein